jgi:hypothetical protein
MSSNGKALGKKLEETLDVREIGKYVRYNMFKPLIHTYLSPNSMN